MEITNEEAIRALASNLSEQFPISTDTAYKVVRNLLRYLVNTIRHSVVEGQDASLVIEKAVCDVATQLNKGLKEKEIEK